jgi:poly(beta-D-mannuronate) C5 epimerase
LVLSRHLCWIAPALLFAAYGAARADYYDIPDDEPQTVTPDVPEGPPTPAASRKSDKSAAAIFDLGSGDDADDQGDGSDQDGPATAEAELPVPTRPYMVDSGEIDKLALQPPKLPDLTKYTPAAAMAKLSRKAQGRASVESMLDKMSFKGFMGKREGLREWAMRQPSMPKIIYIRDGYVTPADLARQLPADDFREVSKGVYVARLPIDVTTSGTLHIPEGVELRLSWDRGAFLVNEGKLFITGAKVRAWNEARNQPAWFRKPSEFRPFITSWAGSDTYIVNSVIAHLGYTASKGYGLSISQFSPGLQPVMGRPAPSGWVINNEIYDNWYGFYTYQAEDVVVLGNNFHDNIHYAIDPHDYSKRLIIANNKTYKTREKHGIIISREVNDSWIIGNESYDNALSGIVVDRRCINTVIANNKVYRNGADGITIYESPKNLIWENVASGNKRHGIRVRNSTDLRLYNNVAIANGLSGIYGHIRDVGQGRNLKLDPYQERVSMTVVGGQLVSNGSSPISVDAPLSLAIYNVDLRAPARQLGIKFTGVLGRYQEQVLDILLRKKGAVVIHPATGNVLTNNR